MGPVLIPAAAKTQWGSLQTLLGSPLPDIYPVAHLAYILNAGLRPNIICFKGVTRPDLSLAPLGSFLLALWNILESWLLWPDW